MQFRYVLACLFVLITVNIVSADSLADCLAMVGKTVRVSGIVYDVEIVDSGNRKGEVRYMLESMEPNLSCGSNARGLYDRGGVIKCKEGQRATAEGMLYNKGVFVVYADTVSCSDK
jgi:hypothetical protein